MPEELSVGKLGVDIAPYLQQLDQAAAADRKLVQGVLDGSARITKSYAELAQQQADSTNRLQAQVAEYRNAQEAARSAAEAVRQYAAREKELQQQQKGLNSATAEYQRITRELEKNAKAIAQARQAQQESTAAAREAQKAAQGIAEANRQAAQQVKLEAAASRDAAASAKQQAAASKEASESAGKGTSFFSGLLSKASLAFAGLFAVEKVVEVGEEIRKVTAEFEKYQITLTGAFNGDQGRAQRALIQVQQFADANGLEITSLTDTYVKLVNRGIIPTTQQLRQLSDIAATSGKSTDQFVEALLDAQTGEFERLKEFGIKVKNNGDTISFSFRGVKQEVKNTSDAISQYLFALGDTQGVQGQAAAQLKSLGGAAADSKNAFTELYQVIGNRTKEIFGGLSNATAGAARALANYFKSTDQEALEKSASGIDRYAQVIGARFNQIAADARASGGNVTQALQSAADDQLKFIETKLAKARRDLAGYYNSAQQASVASGGEVDAVDPAEVARYQTAIKLYEGQREAAKRAYQASVEGAGAEVAAIGRIAALRLKIASEEKARDAAPDNTAGNKERVRLVAQLVADNKLLNELLGKQDKAQQAINDKLAAALRALEQERATLTGLAAKAAEKAADDAAQRAHLTFEEELRQIEVIKQKLIERERAVRAAGGRGRNADGVIDGVQARELNQLRQAAQEQLTRELERIERERQALLLSLQKDSDQKELDQLEAAFNEQVRLHEREAGVLLALEAKYQRDRDALLRVQATRQAERARQSGTNQADATAQVFGAGTGQSVFEAQRAARQQQLDAERQFAEKRLEILRDSKDKDAQVEREALAAQLLRIRNQQRELDAEQKRSKFSIYRLILGENDSPELRAALDEVTTSVLTSLSQITQAQQQAAQQQAADASTRISELTGQLAAEIELHKDGSASNIQTIQNEIKEQKAARREALEDQRAAAKQQVLIDTLTQASSITTAAANVFAAFSAIPFVGPILGAVAAAGLITAFIASKAQAYSAANNIGQGFFRGGYTGGTDEREERGVVHGKEFVSTAKTTKEYRPLLEAIHTGDTGRLDWSSEAMRRLLPDYALPSQLRAEKQAAQEVQHRHSFAPMAEKFDALDTRLAAIEASNDQMANQREAIEVPGGYIIRHPATGSTNFVRVG